MRVEINGEPREVPAGLTIGALLRRLGLSERPVAVERNADIVPRAEHASTSLLTATSSKSYSSWAAAEQIATFPTCADSILLTRPRAPFDTLLTRPRARFDSGFNAMQDVLKIGQHSFDSRLFVGTGKYKDLDETRAALEASGAEVVTVAVRRVDLASPRTRR